MKKVRALGLLLSAAVLLGAASAPVSAVSAEQFVDVKPGDWFYDAVEYVTQEGLFGGISGTEFGPDDAMTRGMFVTVLGRKSQVDPKEYQVPQFSDVPQNQYFAPYVNWAAKNGIVEGTGKDRFSPNAPITREQIAKILYGYAQKTENDVRWSSDAFSAFPDAPAVSGYAVDGMCWATFHGIINGSSGQLKPRDTATRAQVAKIFESSSEVLIHTEIPQPAEQWKTLTDQNGSPTMSIPIPASWEGRYTATALGSGLGVTFYSMNNLYSGSGGLLFALNLYANRWEYENIPSTHFLTRVMVDGKPYDVVYREPTDVQFSAEYQKEYLEMQADIAQMTARIEYFLPEV